MHLQLVLFQFVFMPETLRTNITREDFIVSEAVHKPQMIVPVAFVGERLAAGVAAVGGALAAVDGLQVQLEAASRRKLAATRLALVPRVRVLALPAFGAALRAEVRVRRVKAARTSLKLCSVLTTIIRIADVTLRFAGIVTHRRWWRWLQQAAVSGDHVLIQRRVVLAHQTAPLADARVCREPLTYKYAAVRRGRGHRAVTGLDKHACTCGG